MTTISKQQWNCYRKVQMSGKYNMLDPRAVISTGLAKEVYLFIIENYDDLYETFENILEKSQK